MTTLWSNPTQLQPDDDRDRKDAQRYRHLRDNSGTDFLGAVSDATGVWCETDNEIDAALDAAIARSEHAEQDT